jgi:hypothetical protein
MSAKKKLKKAQSGGSMSPAQLKEARRDSLYNAHKAKTDSIIKSMQNDIPKVAAPKGKDTTRVGSVRITVAKKKSGGQTKSKKK